MNAPVPIWHRGPFKPADRQSPVGSAAEMERRGSGVNIDQDPMTLADPAHQEERTPVVYLGGGLAGVADLIRKAGWRASVLESPETLVDGPETSGPSCLLLDISRPNPEDISSHGPLFIARRPETPIICTAEDVDVALVVNLMKAGSFDVLEKPVTNDSLVGAIRRALQRSESILKDGSEARLIKDRHASLTQRERQVMALITAGLLNKQVGAELGISEITVKAHRGRLMRKMRARSFATLVKMAATLER